MRFRLIIALAAALALGLSAVAHAARVTGGTTTVTPSAAATQLLSDNGITASPLRPATAADGAVTFPIRHGHVNLEKGRALIRHRGGLALTNGTKTFKMRRPAVIVRKHRAFIVAAVRRAHRGWHIRAVARLTGIQRSGTTATATVHITRVTARAVNKLAGHHVVRRGAVLGTASSTVTLAMHP